MQIFRIGITILLFTFPSIGQITLTSSTSVPSIGDSYSYLYDVTPSLNFLQAGPNQSWDFSAAIGNMVLNTFDDPVTSSDPSSYPAATLFEDLSPYAEIFYSSTILDLSQEGYIFPGLVKTIYTDKREALKFPITYNSIFNESFSGTSEDLIMGTIYDRVGNIEIVADGYGELILPYGTVNDVLRVRVITSYTDSYSGSPINTYLDTVYTWYNLFTKVHLASVNVSYENGNLLSHQARYLSENDLVLSIETNDELTHSCTIYPNPTSGKVRIQGLNEVTRVTVYNLIGEVVISEMTDGDLDMSNLHEGGYYIKYSVNGTTRFEKLIKK